MRKRLRSIYFNTEGLAGGGEATATASTASTDTQTSSSTDVKSTTTSTDNTDQSLNSNSNDDVNEAKIPRARLNEEIAKRKELEKRMEHYEKNYKGFDDVYSKDAVFQEAINDIVMKYQKGELTKKEAQQAVSQAQTAQEDGTLSDDDFVSLKEVKRMIGETQAQFDKRVREDSFKQYDTMFTDGVKEFLGEDFHPREVTLLSQIVQQEMTKNNPKALDTFDANLMRSAMEQAKKEYKEIFDKQFVRYDKQKQKNSQPNIQPAPAPKSNMDNIKNFEQDDRARYLREMLSKS